MCAFSCNCVLPFLSNFQLRNFGPTAPHLRVGPGKKGPIFKPHRARWRIGGPFLKSCGGPEIWSYATANFSASLYSISDKLSPIHLPQCHHHLNVHQCLNFYGQLIVCNFCLFADMNSSSQHPFSIMWLFVGWMAASQQHEVDHQPSVILTRFISISHHLKVYV